MTEPITEHGVLGWAVTAVTSICTAALWLYTRLIDSKIAGVQAQIDLLKTSSDETTAIRLKGFQRLAKVEEGVENLADNIRSIDERVNERLTNIERLLNDLLLKIGSIK